MREQRWGKHGGTSGGKYNETPKETVVVGIQTWTDFLCVSGFVLGAESLLP